MSVVDIEDVKTHLNLTTTTHDVELQAIIDAAEAAISALVGPLEPEARADRIRSGSGALVLPVAPVINVVSATFADGTALAVDDLYTDLAAGVVSYADGVTLAAVGTYDVVYVAGRVTCPADIQLAVKELVRHLWQSQRGPTARPGSAASESAGAVPGVAYLMPYRVQELLAPYQQPSIA